MNDLLSLAAQTTGIESSALMLRERSRAITDARALFAYAATEWLKRPGTEVSQTLGMTSSGISVARRRGRRIAESYGFLDRFR